VLSFALLLRFYMQAFRVSFNNQVGTFVVDLTNWLVKPLRKALPGLWGLDLASLLPAYLLQLVFVVAVVSLQGGSEAWSALTCCRSALAGRAGDPAHEYLPADWCPAGTGRFVVGQSVFASEPACRAADPAFSGSHPAFRSTHRGGRPVAIDRHRPGAAGADVSLTVMTVERPGSWKS
jgi:uncharacterized protein YggT (Ycf19 family)